jgi:drug/metabolite transporter (DMT)-like permease
MTHGSSAFRPRDAALLALLALMWGHSFLFIKIAVGSVAPTWIVTIRMIIGGLLLVTIGMVTRTPFPRSARTLGVLALVGTVGAAFPWSAQAWAQQYLDSGLVAVLNATTPVATLVLAVLAGQERLYRNRVIGLGIAVTGSVIVIGGEVGSGRSLAALLVAALATAGYALAAVVTRGTISGRVASLPAAATQLAFGTLALAPIAWGTSGPPPSSVSPITLGALGLLGLLGTGVAFLLYFTLLERVGATNTSLVTYLVPVVGLSSGALFRGERFGVSVYLGALALVTGVWLAQRRPPLPVEPAAVAVPAEDAALSSPPDT